MTQDYETINADLHTPTLTIEEENVLLKARIQQLMADKRVLMNQFDEMRGNPTQDYTKGRMYDPDEGI